jgi:hypothetical protein
MCFLGDDPAVDDVDHADPVVDREQGPERVEAVCPVAPFLKSSARLTVTWNASAAYSKFASTRCGAAPQPPQIRPFERPRQPKRNFFAVVEADGADEAALPLGNSSRTTSKKETRCPATSESSDQPGVRRIDASI